MAADSRRLSLHGAGGRLSRQGRRREPRFQLATWGFGRTKRSLECQQSAPSRLPTPGHCLPSLSMKAPRSSLLLASLAAVDALRVGAPVASPPSRAMPARMAIAVFGASGGTGSEAVLQALERGEDVTCLVRDRSKLLAPRSVAGFTAGSPFASDKLSVTQGSVTNKADVDAVFEGGDVSGVVVALVRAERRASSARGPRPSTPQLYPNPPELTFSPTPTSPREVRHPMLGRQCFRTAPQTLLPHARRMG